VLVGHVVGDDVDDDAQPERVGVADEGVGVEEVAEHGGDGPVVGDVVARVRLRRFVERAEPYGIDAELLEVRQPAADAFEVSHPVAVAVGEAARVDLVDHRVPPPLGLTRGRGVGDLGLVDWVLTHDVFVLRGGAEDSARRPQDATAAPGPSPGSGPGRSVARRSGHADAIARVLLICGEVILRPASTA
jgi:hypothetical protein